MVRFPPRMLLASSIVFLSGCASDGSVSELAGSCSNAYGGEVCSWAMLDGDEVVSVGATIPLASIEHAPMDAAMTWPPTMSAMASFPATVTASTGVTQMTMYWEPMGHTPQTFLVPHFDFHFYLVPEADRLAIDCGDHTKPTTPPVGYVVPDEQLPPDLVALTGLETLIGVCVPEMGMHAISEVEAMAEEAFSGTMIVGYYGARPIFVEPMISQATLLERRTFELTVPRVPGLELQPTVFRAEYDAEGDAYRFTFSGFGQAE